MDGTGDAGPKGSGDDAHKPEARSVAGELVPLGRGGYRPGAGRKPFEPSDAQRELVGKVAALGYTQEQIALFILNPEDDEPISVDTLAKHFRRELDIAALHANAIIGGKLFEKAKSGDMAAIAFWMKTRAGWSEKGPASKEIAPSDSPFETHVIEGARAKLAKVMARARATEAAATAAAAAVETGGDGNVVDNSTD
jgi:hypothetical protein